MAAVAPSNTVTAEEPKDVDILAEKSTQDAADDASQPPSTRPTSVKEKEASSSTPAANVEDYTPKGPVKVPTPHPLPACVPVPRADLTPDQQKKYADLLALVQGWTEMPKSSQRNAEKVPLDDEDRLWLTRECLLRYLRATSWQSADAAAKRLLSTLTWRREYGLRKFTPEYISVENETGKQVVYGFDNEGRSCLYMNPAKQNTDKSDKQLHHVVYMLERAIDLMPPGQETAALIINFSQRSSRGNPNVKQGMETLNILQGHYPERLGRALISDIPWYVTYFFKVISPFIDPVTKTKMKFNEPLDQHIAATQLLKESGGKVDFIYDHAIYWPALATLCENRRKDYQARWEKAGKKIGEHEMYLRGGNGKSLDGELLGSDYPEGFTALVAATEELKIQ